MKNPFSKQPKLKFKTAEAEKKSRTALWLGIFIAFVVLIVIVSFSILLKEYNYDLSTMFQNPDDVKKTTSSATENKSNEQSNITVLFSGVSTDKSDIYYISLININTKDRTFEVKDYSPSDYVTYYTKDAESGLVKALEDSSKSTIDRYVIVSEDNYKKFMNCLGTVTVTSSEAVNYTGTDFTFTLFQGENKLSGENVLKYIRYVGLNNNKTAYENQAQVICNILNMSITTTNIEKGETLFDSLINLADSNISVIDYSKYADFLSNCAYKGFTAKIASESRFG